MGSPEPGSYEHPPARPAPHRARRRRVRPALLVSDVIMPGGMNGLVLAHRPRQQQPPIKVLPTTGYAGDVLVVGSESNSEFEVNRKPYKLDEMARRVRMVHGGPTSAS